MRKAWKSAGGRGIEFTGKQACQRRGAETEGMDAEEVTSSEKCRGVHSYSFVIVSSRFNSKLAALV